MRRRLEEAAYTHTHCVICPHARDCWEGSGSRWSAMALIVSGCGNGEGEACPVQPWPGDAITMSCVSVTVNPLAIIKASPSGSTWQRRAARGQRKRRRGQILQTNGSRAALMFQHVHLHTHSCPLAVCTGANLPDDVQCLTLNSDSVCVNSTSWF